MELPTDARCEFLHTHYPERVAVEALSLLDHHAAAESFLEPPPTEALEALHASPARKSGDDYVGQTFAGRYQIGEAIGEGGTSSVHRAHDEMTGDDVVIKIVQQQHAVRYDVVRLEATALRLLALPGIVRLIDEGVHEDMPFLVMEYVEGRPFPGWSPPVPSQREPEGQTWKRYSWHAIRQPAIGLLETLVRIHSRGIVHADLKPGNVLVRRNGAPVILDLGISRDPGLDEDILRSIALAGTPRYISPEQLDGKPATPASDLYSLGIMLYEVLAGCDPHDARTAHETIARRLHTSPPPLLDVAPEVPPAIAACVDRLIASDTRLRYASALHVIADMEAGAARLVGTDDHYLGSKEFMEQLIARVKAGRSVDVSGPIRSGRSMTLRSLAARLHSQGVDVRIPQAGTRPFESLSSLGVDVSRLQADSRQALRGAAAAKLRGLMTSGVVILVHDLSILDTHSRDMLSVARKAGCVVRAMPENSPGAIPVPPVSIEELMHCFHGRERLHRIPSDAAKQLWLRTGGRAGLVLDELNAWERAGIAHWEGDRMRIDREALTRLRGGLRVRHVQGQVPEPHDDEGKGRPTSHHLLLLCVDLLGRHASPKRCAQTLGISVAEAELQMDELERNGDLQSTDSGGYFCRYSARQRVQLSREQLRLLHRGIAASLPENEPKRLQHLILAGELADVTRSASKLSDALASNGRMLQAWSVLREGLWTAYQTGDRTHVIDLLERLCLYALLASSKRVFALTEYELGRAYVDSELVTPLRRTMRAASFVIDGQAERALDTLPIESPPDRPLAFRNLISVWMFCARLPPAKDLANHIAHAERLCSEHKSDFGKAPLLGAHAWVAYRRFDYRSAAEQHLKAAESTDISASKMVYRSNAAVAYLDAGEFDRAFHLAEEIANWAVPRRIITLMARGEFVLRAVAYRRGEDIEPDPELVAAIEESLAVAFVGMVAINEAAIAWRGGEAQLAHRLAMISYRKYKNRLPGAASLSMTLAMATAPAAPSQEEAGALLKTIIDLPSPADAVQSCYLLSLAAPALAPGCLQHARRRAEEIPPEKWSYRNEVTSISESVK